MNTLRPSCTTAPLPEIAPRRFSRYALPVAWIAVTLLSVGLLVVATPLEFARLQAVCTGAGCTDPHLTPAAAPALRHLGLSNTVYAAYFTTLEVAVALAYGLMGAVLVCRRSSDALALLAAFFLVAYGGATLAGPGLLRALGTYPIWRWAITVTDTIGIVCLGLFLCLFPAGRFVPRWTEFLAAAWALLLAPQYIAPASPLNLETWPALLQLPVWLGLLGGVTAAQVYRYHRLSDRVRRQQTKWVVFGVATTASILLILIVLSSLAPPSLQDSLGFSTIENTFWRVAMLLIPLSIAVAILRHRLWDIDLIINRALVYGALTAAVVGLYVLVVAGLGAVLQAEGSLPLSLLGTGLIAVLFGPLRAQLQGMVNRLMYGDRDEPYSVLSRLGQRLEGTLSPEVVLPTIVETVRQALKLPYAAVMVRQGDGFVITAASGAPSAQSRSLPLIYQQEIVGQLVLAPRLGEEAFSAADQRLLDDLARQAGVAAHAVRLTGELEQARERLVTAREEERRRLRRDLHDGLGPQLGSQTLTLTAVRKLLRRDPDAAEALLDDAVRHAQQAIADIRRVVYDLRPPALDDLGLVGALQEGAARCSQNGLHVSIEAPDLLPPLSAAVEVACYRIVQEALTNVTRHAHARTCLVRLTADGSLTVVIQDDGRGLPAEYRAGVGLLSMRERAVELSGSCTVKSLSGGGARVTAQLPLGETP